MADRNNKPIAGRNVAPASWLSPDCGPAPVPIECLRNRPPSEGGQGGNAMNTTVRFLWVAGGVQLALAVANLWVPKVLRYRQNLAKLSPMVRQVFIVHSVYLVLVL